MLFKKNKQPLLDKKGLSKKNGFPQILKNLKESKTCCRKPWCNKLLNFPIAAKQEWKILECLRVDDLIRLLQDAEKQNHAFPSLQGLCSGAGNEQITAEVFRCSRAYTLPLIEEDSIHPQRCAFVYVA